MQLPIIKTEEEKQSIIDALDNMLDSFLEETEKDFETPLEEDCLMILTDLLGANSYPIVLSLHTTAEDLYLAAWDQAIGL